ncbi:MAG: multiheme c-type cytochrome [Bacteroidetes bacterium]|nr:multiheme c-type cytochrome [Bacteroidota bacterium]
MKNKKFILLVSCSVWIASILSNCQSGSQKTDTVRLDTIPLTKIWESAIPHQSIPKGLTSISAESCGTCHQEIYEEWKLSTHAAAFIDPQFLAEWKKDDVYVCLNCHTPLQNQQEFVVIGLIGGDHRTPVKARNPNFDTKLQLEGINCASCHVRNGKIIGLTSISLAPHISLENPKHLSEQLCVNCHNAVEELYPDLVCTFETGDEWAKGPAFAQGKNCISCHMPIVERELVKGFGKRKNRRHYFPGSGIPKFADQKSVGLAGLEFTSEISKETIRPGDIANFKLNVENKYAGHNVPTGDPERFINVRFSVENKDSVIVEKQFRIGEEWEWYPKAAKISDNNLSPGEVRTFNFEYEIPDISDFVLGIEVTKHRMNEENAMFDSLFDYPLSIKIFEEKHRLKIE